MIFIIITKEQSPNYLLLRLWNIVEKVLQKNNLKSGKIYQKNM
jgi:hypothetical protein